MGMHELNMEPSNGYGILHSDVQRGNPLNKEGYKWQNIVYTANLSH